MAAPQSPHQNLPPRQARDLDIEISFIEGIVRRDPHYVEALQVLGDNYTRRGRFNEGLRIDEQLALLRPNDALTCYNLACSYCLTSQIELAIATLHRALDLGYRDFKWLARDPDLKGLRRHAAYKELRARIKSIQAGPRDPAAGSPQP
jgi:tetratricopeptide (TPR) repeat protein